MSQGEAAGAAAIYTPVTGKKATERDIPILTEAFHRIIDLLGTEQIVDASLEVLDSLSADVSSRSKAFTVKIGSEEYIPARVSFPGAPIGPGRRGNIRIYLSRRVLDVGNIYDLCETGGSMLYRAPYASYIGPSKNVGKVTIRKDIKPGVVNRQAIWRAIFETFETTKGIEVDAASLCRAVLERTDKETIKKFIEPNLTDHEVTEIQQDSAKLGGGRRKKRRSGKKTKGKMRKNSRTIKKNGTKNIKQKTLNKKH
jgi:hypothetical protein